MIAVIAVVMDQLKVRWYSINDIKYSLEILCRWVYLLYKDQLI